MAEHKDCKHYDDCDYRNDIGCCPNWCAQFKYKDDVRVIRCKNCINGIYDEANNIYKCVKSADYDPEYDDWLGFVSYHNADYYCADGKRRTNEN